MLKERWAEYRLPADQRPKISYEYYVSGRGQFPADMLRYDSAWPAGSEDAHKVGLGFHDLKEAYGKVRSVKLHSYHKPTIDRWSSFGWSVGNHDLS